MVCGSYKSAPIHLALLRDRHHPCSREADRTPGRPSGVLVSQYVFGALSWLLVGAVLGSGFLVAFVLNNKAVERAREHFSKPPDDDSV